MESVGVLPYTALAVVVLSVGSGCLNLGHRKVRGLFTGDQQDSVQCLGLDSRLHDFRRLPFCREAGCSGPL